MTSLTLQFENRQQIRDNHGTDKSKSNQVEAKNLKILSKSTKGLNRAIAKDSASFQKENLLNEQVDFSKSNKTKKLSFKNRYII